MCCYSQHVSDRAAACCNVGGEHALLGITLPIFFLILTLVTLVIVPIIIVTLLTLPNVPPQWQPLKRPTPCAWLWLVWLQLKRCLLLLVTTLLLGCDDALSEV
jgi:hypothetical protein